MFTDLLAQLSITKFDVWGLLLLVLLLIGALKACRVKLPDPSLVQAYATICNTKGGIIMILFFLWIFTLVVTVTFCVWVIRAGVSPEHAVVISLLGVLSGTAFGNVNGAFFKTMTGEDPKPPIPPVAPPPPAKTEKPENAFP